MVAQVCQLSIETYLARIAGIQGRRHAAPQGQGLVAATAFGKFSAEPCRCCVEMASIHEPDEIGAVSESRPPERPPGTAMPNYGRREAISSNTFSASWNRRSASAFTAGG